MEEEIARIVIVFVDGTTKDFYAGSTSELHCGVMVWRDAAVENRSVDWYCVPTHNIREVFEYQ